eukprot:366006-Chlamydomonas_euryale.AAC.4
MSDAPCGVMLGPASPDVRRLPPCDSELALGASTPGESAEPSSVPAAAATLAASASATPCRCLRAFSLPGRTNAMATRTMARRPAMRWRNTRTGTGTTKAMCHIMPQLRRSSWSTTS